MEVAGDCQFNTIINAISKGHDVNCPCAHAAVWNYDPRGKESSEERTCHAWREVRKFANPFGATKHKLRLQYAQLFTAKSLFLNEPTTLHLDEPFKMKEYLRLKTLASTRDARSSVAESFVWICFTLPPKRRLKKEPPFNSS